MADDISGRAVDVVDLMTLPQHSVHSNGVDDTVFRELFPGAVDVLFACHGDPDAIHKPRAGVPI